MMNMWEEEVRNATNEQLIGMWESGIEMTSEEYTIWLTEVCERGLIKKVFG